MSKGWCGIVASGADPGPHGRANSHAVFHVPEIIAPPIMKIALLYALGAVFAIGVNIGSQELSLMLLSAFPWVVVLSVMAGTGTGLVFKYVWDKLLIFGFRPATASRDLLAFGGYTLTGVGTTAIFWGFEFGFDLLFGTKLMRYVGGVIGLAIGY
jgi:putative flippase GtrA